MAGSSSRTLQQTTVVMQAWIGRQREVAGEWCPSVPRLLPEVMLQSRGVVAWLGLASMSVSMSGMKTPEGSLRRLPACFSEGLARTTMSKRSKLQWQAQRISDCTKRHACQDQRADGRVNARVMQRSVLAMYTYNFCLSSI